MEEWPEDLKKDMEEFFKSSPKLLKILEQEKQFEDLINKQSTKQDSDNSESEPAYSNGKNDKDLAN